MEFTRRGTGVLFLEPENQFAVGQTTRIDRPDSKSTCQNAILRSVEQQLLTARIAEKVLIAVAQRRDGRNPLAIGRQENFVRFADR